MPLSKKGGQRQISKEKMKSFLFSTWYSFSLLSLSSGIINIILLSIALTQFHLIVQMTIK